MRVYVLWCEWDTEYDNGAEILGVWDESHVGHARECMRERANKIRAEYGDDMEWDADFDEDGDDCIAFGYDPMRPFTEATHYRWELEVHEVQ